MGKRKRSRPSRRDDTGSTGKLESSQVLPVKSALLALYYAEVLTLREYLLLKLPETSKVRKRRILSIGCENHRRKEVGNGDTELALALDRTLVGVFEVKEKEKADAERQHLWTSFSQRRSQDDSRTGEKSVLGSSVCQEEIIDCCIFSLFHKNRGKIQHLLCQGYRRNVSHYGINRGQPATSAIPGVVSDFPNNNVAMIKRDPWPQILELMGKEGEKVMFDLVLDCGIFLAIDSGHGNYHQLSGIPLGDLEVRPNVPQNLNGVSGDPKDGKINSQTEKATSSQPITPGNITFVRNRMLYARAALNAKGNVRFGLRHIHALNRYPYRLSTESQDPRKEQMSRTVAVMKYIFPRQFDLHNVFTSKVNRQETVHPFKDYTLREDEINITLAVSGTNVKAKFPKRLRGKAVELTEKLRKLHERCPYYELLRHYCPTSAASHAQKLEVLADPIRSGATSHNDEASHFPNSGLADQSEVPNDPSTGITVASTNIAGTTMPSSPATLLERATSVEAVSAFCRAVFNRLVPNEFWGTGEVQVHNKSKFLSNVDRFVKLRRFESLSLHEVVQQMKITEVEWLCPPSLAKSKTSQTDLNKRLEIFHEFIYYLFDSLLIPLIRANFHVTESNVDRYRLFFFRHDVWREFTEPAMASLKATMFEEVKTTRANEILASRPFGFSQIRLLPKAIGVRPIMNLRRRMLQKGAKNRLGYSINTTLAPVYNMLTYEKNTNPQRLGSAMFSVGDIYSRLKTYKSKPRPQNTKFYFAKVDVQAAFDTIPQLAVVNLMKSLPQESHYRIAKHVEIKPGEGYRLEGKTASKPIRKWTSLAKAPNDPLTFQENLIQEQGLAAGKKNTVFVENINNMKRGRVELLNLLEDHIKRNLVKIGKKFYRQKEGIPQGSVISSLLCNYFYADLESTHLSFLFDSQSDSLLLRLVDDFLLITVNKYHAEKFLNVMHRGIPEYGVTVKEAKTLTNFATNSSTSSRRLASLDTNFPYCGLQIDTRTLSISKDRSRHPKSITDSLTIEFSHTPGKTFQRKILNAFKIQAHAMFLDSSFNPLSTVIRNLYEAFCETAEKMWAYCKCLARDKSKRPGTALVTGTIEKVAELAVVMVRSKGRRIRGYRCGVGGSQIEWLVFRAFKSLLGRKQSGYAAVLKWLDERLLGLEIGKKSKGEVERIMGMII